MPVENRESGRTTKRRMNLIESEQKENVKIIELTQGKVALIDASDYGLISKYRWYARWDKGTWYAVYCVYPEKGRKYTIFIHRIILDVPKDLQVDHINGDGLDCRRINMRICTQQQNMCNRKLNCNNTSGYKGVSWHKPNKKWVANITINRKQLYLGLFYSVKDAAQAYNKAAIKHHGEFARINNIDGSR